MSFITTFMKNVKDFYSEINAATLTGAIDVIVVEQEDGSLNASPFHVRFGKMGVLKAREKIVDIEINGEPVDIWMKLDDTGAAFFVEDVDEDEEDLLPADLATSPLPKNRSEYFDTKTELLPELSELDDAEEVLKMRKRRKTRRELQLTRSGSKKAAEVMFDMDSLHDADSEDEDDFSLGKELSISELVDNMENMDVGNKETSRVSFSSGYHSDPELAEEHVKHEYHDSIMSKSVGSNLFSADQVSHVSHLKLSQTMSEPGALNLDPSEEMTEDVSWKWGELPRHEDSRDSLKKDAEPSTAPADSQSSWFRWSKSKEESKEETVGVYLDDIEQNPDLMEKYIGPFKTETDPLDIEQPRVERLDSGYASGDDPTNLTFQDVAISLCPEGSETELTEEMFASHQMTYSSFVEKIRENPNFLSDNSQPPLIKLHGKYMPWNVAAPIILSGVLFKQPLHSELMSELTNKCQTVKDEPLDNQNASETSAKPSSWFGWFGKGSQQNNSKELAEDLKIDVEMANSGSIEASEQIEERTEKRFRKSIRLTSEQLRKFNLKRGSNEMEFSVTTAFQGTTRCSCHIYLWHHSDKVVISDIDGTITKSDVLGHLLPVIGRDWAQSGVAQLYTKIRNNGYQIIYLSARAIGQASITKDYLQSLKQGDVCLPDGPLFLNPDSLIHAFKREVIDRNPEEFKIRCLKDIQSLFDGKNPFFAGYGNRPNDAYAYRAVGIPVSRIFTINPAGELKHELTQNFQTSFDEQESVVDYVFPLIGFNDYDPEFELQKYSTFGFWRDTFSDYNLPIIG